MSATLNQRQPSTFLSNTVANPKNDSHCHAITIRSGKTTRDLPIPIIDEQTNDDNVFEVENSSRQYKGKDKSEEPILKPNPRPHASFPQRVKRKQEEGEYKFFLSMLKKLSINIPLVEALEKMLGYEKFMKNLITKKRSVSYKLVDSIYHCSAVATRSLVKKKEDLSAFTISCSIGSFDFAHSLCDLRANINLISLAIFK